MVALCFHQLQGDRVEAGGAPKAGTWWSDTPGPGKTEPSSAVPILTRLGVWPLTEVFLSRLGIGILLLAVAYFFKYSIDQGWLVPAVRLGIGVLAGAALLAMGFKGASKGEPIGTALAGGAIATFFITGYTGHQWYSLVSYPAAFGFLLVASALGIFLSLRSGLQALAIVGLIGALATPLLLTAQTTDVAGLALYVSLIVASVGTIYMARAWRAVFLLAAVTSWLVLSVAVSQAGSQTSTSIWVLQGGIAFCALVFWLIPLLRAELRAGNPEKWTRPEGAPYEVPWSAHLDLLSLVMPLAAIFLTAWLWDLSQVQLGWVFSGVALSALGVGQWISKARNPEDSASTQWFVALLLATVGLGLILKGDVLYLAFIAEAVALITVGSRKGSRVILGSGIVMEVVVLTLFLSRLLLGGTLFEGDLSSIFDLAAIGGAVFSGTRLHDSGGRQGFFIAAYLGSLAFLGRELAAHTSFLYLAYVLAAVLTQVSAVRWKSLFLSYLGHVPAFLVLAFFVNGMQIGRNLLGGDLTSFVDLAALGAAVYIGFLSTAKEVKWRYFSVAYAGLLLWTARELEPLPQGQALMSLAFGLEGTMVLVAGYLMNRSVLQKVGMATLLMVVVKVLLVDLAAVEPIWRVLLLALFGGLFLLLSKFVQGRRKVGPKD